MGAKALAMKKKGVGIFAPKTLSPALAAICGGKSMARTEVTKKLWVYIKKHSLNNGRIIKPDSTLKASSRREHRHAQNAFFRKQAPVVRDLERVPVIEPKRSDAAPGSRVATLESCTRAI